VRGLVVVTDNPLMAGAIRAGLHEDQEAFQLLGYLNPRKATAGRLEQAGAEVVLIDEAENPERAVDLIRQIRQDAEQIAIVLVAMQMSSDRLEEAIEAGANSVIFKAIHPGALATFLDAALSGHIVHSPARIATAGETTLAPNAGGIGGKHSSLTPRELGILRLVAAGASNSEIADQLWITRQTVKFHLSNVYRKLGVSNRTSACRYAHLNGVMADAPDSGAVPVDALALAS
jgi:DNA-binding NarL/FixJ family response regulator